jgi:flagella basal body P-ring formation protein FlgA
LIAVENLRAGIPIKSGQIREEVTDAFPLSSGRLASLSQVEGLIPLRAIASGAEVRPDDVGQPYEVNRGDLVHVEVRAGAARLALTGRAESAGRVGDLVPVRNIDSSRVFPAVVAGKDSVVVLLRDTEESLK